MTVSRRHCAYVHAETTGDGGPHLILIEDFALDLAGFDHLFCERLEHRLSAQREAKRLHATDQATLAMAHGHKLLGQ